MSDSIQPDQTLLHYRLIAKIGEGGMGQIWKAFDGSLDREVAIKILPGTVAQNPERLARFEREAKAVAALAHPNILAVHDFGREADTTYMVTELLEGGTLRERLAEGPLPPRKAAELARQVARGLAAAHEKGIVHRDLKPENVFVTGEGRAKILDFGLAASVTPGGADPMSTHTPTATGLTSPGTVMGTADYMSPEQVRGEAVDHRSDVFSFGTMLYEMLTGARPFRRETTAETMTAVLREDPASSPSESRVEVPVALDRVVRRCLEKQPAERFQSASDLAFAVENALGSTGAVSAQLDAVADAPASTRSLRLWPVLAALVVLFGVGFLLGRLVSPPPAPEPTFSQLTFREGRISTARFAGDGRTVVYSAGWDGEGLRLYTVHEGSPESRSLGIDDAEVLSVSSQGELALLLRPRFVVGWSARGTLARMPLGGGAPREMLENISSADWDPSGEELAIVRFDGNSAQLEYPPGKILYETRGWIGNLRFSPDGTRLAFADHPDAGDDRGFVAISDLGDEIRRLGTVWSAIQGIAWTPDGNEVLFTAGHRGNIRALHAVDEAGAHRVLSSAPVDVKLLDVDAAGRVLISRNTSARRIVGRPPGAAEEIPLSWLDWSYPGGISEDGTLVFFTEQGEGGGDGYGSYLRPTDGGAAVRIGKGQAWDLHPDGTRVVSKFIDRPRLVVYPTGTGESHELDIPGFDAGNGFWTGNGDEMLVVGSLDGGLTAAFVHDPTGGGLRPVTPENVNAGSLRLHRQRRLITARILDGPLRIYSLDGDGEPRELTGIDSRQEPVGWTAGGRGLYLVERGRIPMPVTRYDIESGRQEPFMELMPAEPAGLIDIGPAFFTESGDAYLYSYRRYLSTLYLAEGF